MEKAMKEGDVSPSTSSESNNYTLLRIAQEKLNKNSKEEFFVLDYGNDVENPLETYKYLFDEPPRELRSRTLAKKVGNQSKEGDSILFYCDDDQDPDDPETIKIIIDDPPKELLAHVSPGKVHVKKYNLFKKERDLVPTQVNDEAFVHEKPRPTNPAFTLWLEQLELSEKIGKWMLFYPKSELDEAWLRAKDLFRGGRLRGIACMTVSTNWFDDARVLEENRENGLILFYCFPAQDEELMKEYGQNVIDLIQYKSHNNSPYVLFKTGAQTEYRTLGQTVKHLYKILLTSGNTHANWLQRIAVGQPELDDGANDERAKVEKRPMEETEEVFIGVRPRPGEPAYADAVELAPHATDFGKWMLFYPKEDLDAAWDRAKTAFHRGTLRGIVAMSVSTARTDETHKNKVIFFFCGPASDERRVMDYGVNLVEIMNYRRLPFIPYKSEKQSESGCIATGQKVNSLYRIRVPCERRTWRGGYLAQGGYSSRGEPSRGDYLRGYSSREEPSRGDYSRGYSSRGAPVVAIQPIAAAEFDEYQSRSNPSSGVALYALNIAVKKLNAATAESRKAEMSAAAATTLLQAGSDRGLGAAIVDALVDLRRLRREEGDDGDVITVVAA